MHDPRRTVAGACLVAVAGAFIASPPFRREALRITSVTAGRSAVGLRALSVATGLRYVDMAYPPEADAGDAVAR